MMPNSTDESSQRSFFVSYPEPLETGRTLAWVSKFQVFDVLGTSGFNMTHFITHLKLLISTPQCTS